MLRKIAIYIVCFMGVLILAVAVSSPAYAATVTPHFSVSIDPASNEVSVSTPSTDASTAQTGKFILDRTKVVTRIIFGLCAITSLAAFICQIVKLGAAGANEMLRRRAIQGLLVSGSALSLFGGLSVFASFFWKLIS